MSHIRVLVVRGGPEALESALNEDLPASHDLIQVVPMREHAWLVLWQEARSVRVEQPVRVEAERAVSREAYAAFVAQEPAVVPAMTVAEGPAAEVSLVDRLKFWRRA